MLYNLPGKLHIDHLGLVRLCLGDAHFRSQLDSAVVQVLDKHASVNGNVLLALHSVRGHIYLEQPEVLFGAKYLERFRGKFRSHNYLEEYRLHQGSGLSVNRAVRGYYSAEDAYLVGFVCLGPGVRCIFSYCRSARIHMLETYAERRSAKFPYNVESCVGVLYVVVRQFLAVELLGAGEGERNLFGTCVELCLLVRVLAVAQSLLEVEFEEKLFVQPCLFTHEGSDCHIVFSSVCICLGGELKACLWGGVSVCPQFFENCRVVLRIDHNCH